MIDINAFSECSSLIEIHSEKYSNLDLYNCIVPENCIFIVNDQLYNKIEETNNIIYKSKIISMTEYSKNQLLKNKNINIILSIIQLKEALLYIENNSQIFFNIKKLILNLCKIVNIQNETLNQYINVLKDKNI